jgi:hypothetical protein
MSDTGITGRPSDTPVDAGRVKELWQRAVKATRTERQQAAVNSMFLRNRHWVYWNRGTERLEELPREPSRVRATVPRMGPDSRRIIAKLMRRPLSFDVQPTSPDDAATRAARTSEAALAEAQIKRRWEQVRHVHASQAWEAGVAGLFVDWDWTAGTPLGQDERGRTIGTGQEKVDVVSIHEIACEPGTRDIETARWWIRAVALPPGEVRDRYGLPSDPKADARAIDLVWRLSDTERTENVPLTMVLTYYERPMNGRPGQVLTVVNDRIVDQGEWPFPFTDRLNIAVAVVEPVYGRWYGHTPVSDAVGVQALLNASWSSIVEHMKLAGNARLWVPQGSVDDVEELTDQPGEAVEYNPINGLRPTYEAPPSMPDWWIRQPDMLGNALDNILGVHDVSRGEAPTGVESGIALSILSENDDTPVGALAKSLGECWGRVATMVLQLWEANVEESREAVIHYGGIPEVVKWSGGDLMGQTTATVPLDSVMPRSRAAQAAYAMQLFDRGILTDPQALAKVADLPDQDDLIAGIDPDTHRAMRENYWLATGQPRTVDTYDDHGNHIRLHRDFCRSERYEYLPDGIKEMILQHLQAHEVMAAEQAAQQAMTASVSPIAAVLPTVATQPVPSSDLASATAMSTLAPAIPTPEPEPELEPDEEPT